MSRSNPPTTPKRIRTVYFWTEKQIDDAKKSADELYNYFNKSVDKNRPKLSADQKKWIKLTNEIAEKASR